MTTTSQRPLSRQILSLAVPAFGALIAEPLFLLADTAMIGRLGAAELAGVGLAAAIVQTATGVLIFLAYSTTPAVARFLGAGQLHNALARGRDGIWLGLGLGAVLAVIGWFAAPLLAKIATQDAAPHAINYLQYSMLGLPAMLAVLAATGVLRGLQDAKTPLIVAGAGFGLNILGNYLLIYVLGLGVIGSALGTSVIQWLMLAVYAAILIPRMRKYDVGFAPTTAGLRATAQVGSWLLVRSASVRVAIMATVLTATSLGTEVLAAHQIVFNVYSTMAFALDALAIAAQALIGKELGASNVPTVRALTSTMIRWSFGFGVITGLLLGATAVWLPYAFTTDPAVIEATTAGLIVLAVSQPLSGYVFVLDGILMGAGDAKYLGLIGIANIVIYLPALAGLASLATNATHIGAVAYVWIGFAGVFMAARALGLWLRIRKDTWIRLGAH
ncbi:MAG TPA: MATE family efflux transporter [Enteractinococcus helveticum]|uniref:MATE family efflux transporter n=1 Tax=Enteractinococcus helveticum TaxID=1837282 RepID=A0A921FP04_9MICC|nr:MATE family efflux transporter [Enteractinococcus helveticum]HJF14817.1 MATE family efflux transporter [Enteractinococcus helveticum]